MGFIVEEGKTGPVQARAEFPHASNPADIELLEGITRELIESKGFTAASLANGVGVIGRRPVMKNEGWDGEVMNAALQVAKTLEPAILGRIVFAWPEQLSFEHPRQDWLNTHKPGPEMVHRIAATTIFCYVRHLLNI